MEKSSTTTCKGALSAANNDQRERFYSVQSESSLIGIGGAHLPGSNENSISAKRYNEVIFEFKFKSQAQLSGADWGQTTFKNLQKIQYQRFEDIVKRKEQLMTDMYLSDKDLFSEAKRYLSQLNDMFAEI